MSLLKASSNRVQEPRPVGEKGWAVEDAEASAGVCQEILLRNMTLRITSSLLMHGVRADLEYFPRAAATTAIYRTRRT